MFGLEDLLNWLKSVFGESGEIINEIHEWITNFPEKLFAGFRYIVDQLAYYSTFFFNWASNAMVSVIDGIGIAMETNAMFVLIAPVVATGAFVLYCVYGWWFANYAYEKIPIIG